MIRRRKGKAGYMKEQRSLPIPGMDGCSAIGDDALSVRSYPLGPVLVRGGERIRCGDGSEVPLRRRVTAICRCGYSKLGLFCDGTHRFVLGRDQRG